MILLLCSCSALKVGEDVRLAPTAEENSATSALVPDDEPRQPETAGEAISTDADATSDMAVADVLQYVLASHPAICLHKQEVEIARAALITARLLPNPQLVLDVEAEEPDHTTDLSTRLMFTVPLGPKRRLRTRAAATAVRESQAALSREAKLLLMEAADAAIEVLYYQELVALDRHIAGLETQLVGIQKERFSIAVVPYRNVILAELSASTVALASRAAQSSLEQARVRLSRAMGQAECATVSMRGVLTVEPICIATVETILNQARQVAPELAQSQAAVEKSRQQLALERWNALPDAALGPRAGTRWGGDESEDRVGARFAMDVPIFDRNQGGIAESQAQLQAACARYQLSEISTLNDVKATYAALAEVQSRWEYYRREIRPLIERTEMALREAFNDRAVTAYELVEMLESAARMRLSELELRYQHQRMRTRLELLLECNLSLLAGASAEPVPAPPGNAPG